MTVSKQQWQEFYQTGVIDKTIPSELAEAWQRCSKHGLDFHNRIKEAPVLLSDELETLNRRYQFWSEYVEKAQLQLKGCIFFLDSRFYLMNTVKLARVKLPTEDNLVGSKLSEKYIGNFAANMALTLKRPMYVSGYEHVNEIFHGWLGYAEPVIANKELVGALAIYVPLGIEESTDKRNIYNILRLVLQGFHLGRAYRSSFRSERKRTFEHKGFVAKYSFNDIKHNTVIMKKVIERATLISKSEQPILIYGESGTGKELMASAIHNASGRKEGPFVAVNCASLTETLVTSELFGYSEGSFTGAVKNGKKGKIEFADTGTLFLDEVGDLSLAAQASLLRVLEEYEIMRIGDDRIVPVDIRFVCATNKDLREMCEKKKFRWDLYYRLEGMVLTIPPLTEREEDISALAKYFLSLVSNKYGEEKKIAANALEVLKKYNWPGNVRELKNVLETAYLLSEQGIVDKPVVLDILELKTEVDKLSSNQQKRERFIEVLETVGGRVSVAAKKLGISRATAYRWLKEHKAEED